MEGVEGEVCSGPEYSRVGVCLEDVSVGLVVVEDGDVVAVVVDLGYYLEEGVGCFVSDYCYAAE